MIYAQLNKLMRDTTLTKQYETEYLDVSIATTLDRCYIRDAVRAMIARSIVRVMRHLAANRRASEASKIKRAEQRRVRDNELRIEYLEYSIECMRSQRKREYVKYVLDSY